MKKLDRKPVFIDLNAPKAAEQGAQCVPKTGQRTPRAPMPASKWIALHPAAMRLARVRREGVLNTVQFGTSRQTFWNGPACSRQLMRVWRLLSNPWRGLPLVGWAGKQGFSGVLFAAGWPTRRLLAGFRPVCWGGQGAGRVCFSGHPHAPVACWNSVQQPAQCQVKCANGNLARH